METWLAVVLVIGGMIISLFVLGLAEVPLLALHRPVQRPRVGENGTQEVEIVVLHGYTPDKVQVRQGAPVRITFDRRESGECTEWVVFPGLGIVSMLPPFRRTPVEFTPPAPGEFEFRCKLGACRGRLIVVAR